MGFEARDVGTHNLMLIVLFKYSKVSELGSGYLGIVSATTLKGSLCLRSPGHRLYRAPSAKYCGY